MVINTWLTTTLCWTLIMTRAEVVETSVINTKNNPSQDYSQPGWSDHPIKGDDVLFINRVFFSSRSIGSSLPIWGALKMCLAKAGKIMLRDRSWRQMVTASGRNLTLKNCLMIGQERLVSHGVLHIVFHIKIKRNKSWLFITGSGSVKWSNRWMLSVWLTDNNVTDCE